MNNFAFSSLDLAPELVSNLTSLGYNDMTPIQAQSLPHVLLGKDVVAQGKTGSGKTAVFSLGILAKLDQKSLNVQSIVLCPTRELADQVAKEIRKLARAIQNVKVLTLCGGMPFTPQKESLTHGAHIIVGTPGRVEEHLRKGFLRLESVTTFVLDEADRMLDMGFQKSLEAIIEYIPLKRQTLLFSATYPNEIRSMVEGIMLEPFMVQLESTHDSSSIKQAFYKIDDSMSRIDSLRLILLKHQPESTVVFCNTKRDTLGITKELRRKGFSALALNGDLDQKERESSLVRFENKSVSILVATDVAARGLDIDALDAVINYHMAGELEVHVHRIGRTGRAGSKGMAFTLYQQKEEYKLARLEEYLKHPLEFAPMPSASLFKNKAHTPGMSTLKISGGKKQKVRAGDILGALTGENGIDGKMVGKIHIFDSCAFVAVNRRVTEKALKKLSEGKLKGRSFRVARIGG